MEVLILPAVVAIVTAVLLPRLAPIGHKALFMVATAPVLFYLYCLCYLYHLYCLLCQLGLFCLLYQ